MVDARKPAEDERLPRRFDAFLLDRVIWRGLHSTVYQGRDMRDQAAVALKVLYPEPDCDLEAQRRNGAHEASRLREVAHPNIIELRKHGECEGTPYLSFPYINGQGLDQAFQDRAAPPQTILAAMIKVCRALHHAHACGIIHRDLKPRNILLGTNGEPYVLDWGLSWRKGDAKRGVQSIVGTPAYMSPEQARGEEARLTPASDVYSLGAILYHLLTGKPPFEADTSWKTLQMAMSMPPRPPSGLRSTLDPRLERIVLACLEKEPEKRYAGAKALAADLERVLNEGEPKGPTRVFGRSL
ncbi:MAG: serine/threonine-protein kinase [Planctomycetota bacterium]|nr:serine/threonine-protein kinase [Planctomycetota bacterium]